jgi:hypothetical protein
VIPSENSIVEPRSLHMEILDTSTREVWQTLQPVKREDYDALELERRFIKVGIGRGAMDESWFRRSPGAKADGAMKTLEIGGHTWSFCARPEPATSEGSDPRRLSVDKHHTLVFHPGRVLPVIRLPDGSEYVHTIDAGRPLELPDGFTRREIELGEKRIVDLPAPTIVFFFANGDSFQGPASIEE